jgi:proteasome lid subunit RPN8/RPN11
VSTTLPRPVFDAIVEHAERERPRECCGLLVGQGDHAAAQQVRIDEAVPARNLAEDPDRFLLDPVDHIRTRRAARARGLEIVGFYHSHPHSPAHPSARDLAEATYVDALYFIVSLESDPAVVRAYTLAGGRFVELPLRIGDDEDRG